MRPRHPNALRAALNSPIVVAVGGLSMVSTLVAYLFFSAPEIVPFVGVGVMAACYAVAVVGLLLAG